jgi:hypothetical protein
MLRQIYLVAATQVVASDSNPQGVYSNVTGYPITRDSRDYEATAENPNGNAELALIVAQADYADAVKALSIAHNRAGWAVTLERWDGVQLARKSFGAFPDMTPAPEPEPEPEEQGENVKP